MNTIYLPGGVTIRWTGLRVIKHDGSQHHLIGIRPTVPVEQTIAGIRNARDGRDEFIEKAVEIIQQEPGGAEE